jgi:hypothetical protein
MKKTHQANSFFNFLHPPMLVKEDGNTLNEDKLAELGLDGHSLATPVY